MSREYVGLMLVLSFSINYGMAIARGTRTKLSLNNLLYSTAIHRPCPTTRDQRWFLFSRAPTSPPNTSAQSPLIEGKTPNVK